MDGRADVKLVIDDELIGVENGPPDVLESPDGIPLGIAIERMDACFAGAATTGDALTRALRAEAIAIHDEDRAYCLAMGRHGAALLPQSGGVLTHCNTGALATGGICTALGVLRVAI